MAPFQRGIAPDLLVSQVRNTMPYLFEAGEGMAPISSLKPAQVVLKFDREPSNDLDHFEYYKLCLSAHYLTVGTPVPTDVDNQIRQKLWPKKLPLETALEMADLVLESRHWDFTLLSKRYVFGASGTEWERQALSGHLGEWFTVASGAYCAFKQYSGDRASKKRQEIFDAVANEVHRHSEIFGSLWRAKDGVGCLKASASIAHNFGDLDRVMDMWELSVDDPLRLQFYKLSAVPFDSKSKLRYLGRLWVAGELYKSTIEGSSLALENHRHFALRKPRSLRRSPDYFIPTGPFFDAWGRTVAKIDEIDEVVEALKQGWDRTPRTLGYGRALRGILESHTHLKIAGISDNHSRRALMETPQERFEKRWAEEALKLMDEIPSRA